MNQRIIFIGILIFTIGSTFAQPKSKPRSIISTAASIKKYYDKTELEAMQKGELIVLYQERIKLLVNTLPYIALANKPGITMTDIGIPDSTDNRKLLDSEIENTSTFLTTNADFQSKTLPYADKSTLVTCILFYQNTLRELHIMND